MAYLATLASLLLTLYCGVDVSLADDEGWQPGIATWYGGPNGDGSNGGACGYANIVGQPPFSSKVTAVAPPLFRGGRGCGECYQIKCEESGLCAESPVTAVITDECPGCSSPQSHFDLSGTAFSSMAFPAKASDLLNAGLVNILFRRVACEYPGKTIAFHVNEGATAYWVSFLIEYEDGDGDLGAVYLKQANSETWQAMQQQWGANWVLNGGGSPLQAPFSIRLVTLATGKTLTANQVIPQNWKASATYTSIVNFD